MGRPRVWPVQVLVRGSRRHVAGEVPPPLSLLQWLRGVRPAVAVPGAAPAAAPVSAAASAVAASPVAAVAAAAVLAPTVATAAAVAAAAAAVAASTIAAVAAVSAATNVPVPRRHSCFWRDARVPGWHQAAQHG